MSSGSFLPFVKRSLTFVLALAVLSTLAGAARIAGAQQGGDRHKAEPAKLSNAARNHGETTAIDNESFFLLFNAALNFDSLNTERAEPPQRAGPAAGDHEH